jgi:F-box-like
MQQVSPSPWSLTNTVTRPEQTKRLRVGRYRASETELEFPRFAQTAVLSTDDHLACSIPPMLPDPRLVPYSTNNDPFPEVLGPPLDVFLDYLSRSLSNLDDEIARVEDVLEKLKAERQAVEDQNFAYRSLKSPARRIPPELIAKIIRFTVADRGQPLDRSARQEFKRLRCVSSVWREIAFSTQELWRNLVFPFDAVSWEHGGIDLNDQLNSWLDRGGKGAPRALVALNGNRRVRRNCEVALSWIMGIADDPDCNVTSLTLDPALFDDGLMYVHKPSTKGRRSVRNLAMALPEDMDIPVLELDAAYPDLECLAVMDCLLGTRNIRPINFCHSTATSLSLHRVDGTIQELTSALGGLPALTELILASVNVGISSGGTDDDVSLPLLRRLVIIDSLEAPNLQFYRKFVCPSLEYIHLEDVPHYFYVAHNTLFLEVFRQLVDLSRQPLILDLAERKPSDRFRYGTPNHMAVLKKGVPPVHTLYVNEIHELPIEIWESSQLASSLRQIVARDEPDPGQLWCWAKNMESQGHAREHGFKLTIYAPRLSSRPVGKRDLSETAEILRELGIELVLLPPGTVAKMLDHPIQSYEYHRVFKYQGH